MEASGGHQQTGDQGELTHEPNTTMAFSAKPKLLWKHPEDTSWGLSIKLQEMLLHTLGMHEQDSTMVRLQTQSCCKAPGGCQETGH